MRSPGIKTKQQREKLVQGLNLLMLRSWEEEEEATKKTEKEQTVKQKENRKSPGNQMKKIVLRRNQ